MNGTYYYRNPFNEAFVLHIRPQVYPSGLAWPLRFFDAGEARSFLKQLGLDDQSAWLLIQEAHFQGSSDRSNPLLSLGKLVQRGVIQLYRQSDIEVAELARHRFVRTQTGKGFIIVAKDELPNRYSSRHLRDDEQMHTLLVDNLYQFKQAQGHLGLDDLSAQDFRIRLRAKLKTGEWRVFYLGHLPESVVPQTEVQTAPANARPVAMPTSIARQQTPLTEQEEIDIEAQVVALKKAAAEGAPSGMAVEFHTIEK